jgi:hypothetical protein
LLFDAVEVVRIIEAVRASELVIEVLVGRVLWQLSV